MPKRGPRNEFKGFEQKAIPTEKLSAMKDNIVRPNTISKHIAPAHWSVADADSEYSMAQMLDQNTMFTPSPQ